VSFALPQLLLLALVAPAAGAAAWAILRQRARVEAAWAGRALAPRLRRGGPPRPVWLVAGLVALAALGCALALARPRWGSSTRTVERRGVDLVFVLDTSRSMAAADVAPSRFWLAQSIVRRLAESLPGERVALVAAEGVGVVLTPLTVDGAVVDLLLDATEPDSLPVPGSRLGPALERALELFPQGSETHRAIVVLSDGELHGESLDPTLEALRAAGAVVHAIGVGTPAGAPIPAHGDAGRPARREDGELVVTRLEPAALERLAKATGGSYRQASDPTFDPAPVAAAIAAMPDRRHQSTTLETLEERFQWPLGASVLALGLWLALGRGSPRRHVAPPEAA
jgi:Ca-activated chloride channel family protein